MIVLLPCPSEKKTLHVWGFCISGGQKWGEKIPPSCSEQQRESESNHSSVQRERNECDHGCSSHLQPTCSRELSGPGHRPRPGIVCFFLCLQSPHRHPPAWDCSSVRLRAFPVFPPVPSLQLDGWFFFGVDAQRLLVQSHSCRGFRCREDLSHHTICSFVDAIVFPQPP